MVSIQSFLLLLALTSGAGLQLASKVAESTTFYVLLERTAKKLVISEV